MRYLAEIEGRREAEAFVAYLMTLSVSTQIDKAKDGDDRWELWVRDEDDVPKAKSEFELFVANPADPRYESAIAEAKRLLKEQRNEARTAAKNVRRVVHRTAAAPMSGLSGGRIPPLTLTLLILSIAVSLLSNFSNPPPNSKWAKRVDQELSFVSDKDLRDSGQDPAASLKRGEVWRAITPVFLHGDPIHLALNMFMLVMLGRIAEQIDGTSRYAMVVFLLALIPNLLAGLLPRDLGGSPNFVGISGVVYGLCTYLWIISQHRPDLGFRVPTSLILILVLFMVLGFAGVFRDVSNWSHLGGFVVGIGLGLIRVR